VSREEEGREAESLKFNETSSRREALLLAAVLAATWGLLAGAPLVRGVPPVAGGVLVTILFTAAVLGASALVARLELSALSELLGMTAALALWYVVAGAGEPGTPIRLIAVPAADVIFLLACVLGGRLLSRILRERSIMLPIALVLALTDVFTVFVGPTAVFLSEAPEIVEHLSMKLPAVGSAAGPEGAAGLTHFATLGPGDVFFAAVLLACVVRFDLNLRASFWWMFGVVGAGLALFVAVPGLPPLPVLPLMAVAFLIANRGRFQLTAQERRNTVIAVLFVIVLLAGLGLLTRRVAERAAQQAPQEHEAPTGPQAASP